LPDVNRSRPAAAKSVPSAPDDPRLALAQQYLKSASADVAEKEAAQRQPHRGKSRPSNGPPRAFSLTITPATIVHVLLSMVAFTFAAVAALWCLHLLLLNFAAGRIVALPTGVIVFAALSYVSVIFLSIIETTSAGRTEVDSLPGDWRDWFWTLPSTLGMLGVAAFVGWFLSLGLPINVWLLIGLCALLLYPVLELSTLENGSPVAPLSLPVLQSMARHPFGWFIFYAITFALANLLWMVGRLAWHDPPYVTVLIMGPLVTLALLFYAWLLGQLALLISRDNLKTDKESS
jgi:hypothetical protein